MSPRPIIGPKVSSEGTTFTIWAGGRTSAEILVEGQASLMMDSIGDGYFRAAVPAVREGARYRFSVDGSAPLPDLASRWQPSGSDGPSEVYISDWRWTDQGWPGLDEHDQVIYELHVGTFTSSGTWQAAAEKLEHLRDLGVTVLQVMPVGTFAGEFGWGYDTVLPFAPFHAYGPPDDMRKFVDQAHRCGLGVILDVVYNHAGLGDHYGAYSDRFFTDRHENEWGPSFDFDGDHSRPVRDFVVDNAVYWITEFHLDGLRIDAVQAMIDTSEHHIVAELTAAVRRCAGDRKTYVLVENQPQQQRMVAKPSDGGMGVDAMYSDDFQHAARVAATGHNDFYYRDYRGRPQELVSALKYGFLYQGQRSNMRDAPYGTDNLETPPHRFVHFLENHDQVANSVKGERLGSIMSPARLRTLTAMLLLGPQTPALFQGQEFGATNAFNYFFGIGGEAGRSVENGRRASLTHFMGVSDPEMLAGLPDPTSRDTYMKSKLEWGELEPHGHIFRLHRDLISMRRSDLGFSQRTVREIDGAVIGDAAFLIRLSAQDKSLHRMLLINLGRDLEMDVLPEPLLAPPGELTWRQIWSSEHPNYGGGGRTPVGPDGVWILRADTAVLFGATDNQETHAAYPAGTSGK